MRSCAPQWERSPRWPQLEKSHAAMEPQCSQKWTSKFLKLKNFCHELKCKLKYLSNSCAYGFLTPTHSTPISTSMLIKHQSPAFPSNGSKSICFSVSSFIGSRACVACVLAHSHPNLFSHTKPKAFFCYYKLKVNESSGKETAKCLCITSLIPYLDFVTEQNLHGKVSVNSLGILSQDLDTLLISMQESRNWKRYIYKKDTFIYIHTHTFLHIYFFTYVYLYVYVCMYLPTFSIKSRWWRKNFPSLKGRTILSLISDQQWSKEIINKSFS